MKTIVKNGKLIFTMMLMAVMVFTFSKSKAQETLLPDQNPNYKRSMEKYMQKKDELTKTEGETVQATYKAIDDMQIKQERKDLRRDQRHERKLARINSRRRGFNNNFGYSPYAYAPYNNGYNYNYGYGWNPYSNNYPYSNYAPLGYGNTGWSPSCGLNWALLGLGTYLLLK